MLPLPIRTGAVQRFPIPVTIHSRGQIVEQKRCIGFNFPGRPNLRADRCIPWWGFYPTIIVFTQLRDLQSSPIEDYLDLRILQLVENY